MEECIGRRRCSERDSNITPYRLVPLCRSSRRGKRPPWRRASSTTSSSCPYSRVNRRTSRQPNPPVPLASPGPTPLLLEPRGGPPGSRCTRSARAIVVTWPPRRDWQDGGRAGRHGRRPPARRRRTRDSPSFTTQDWTGLWVWKRQGWSVILFIYLFYFIWHFIWFTMQGYSAMESIYGEWDVSPNHLFFFLFFFFFFYNFNVLAISRAKECLAFHVPSFANNIKSSSLLLRTLTHTRRRRNRPAGRWVSRLLYINRTRTEKPNLGTVDQILRLPISSTISGDYLCTTTKYTWKKQWLPLPFR